MGNVFFCPYFGYYFAEFKVETVQIKQAKGGPSTSVGAQIPRDRGRPRDVRSTGAGLNYAGGKFNEKKHKQKADLSSSRGHDDSARFSLGDLRRG